LPDGSPTPTHRALGSPRPSPPPARRTTTTSTRRARALDNARLINLVREQFGLEVVDAIVPTEQVSRLALSGDAPTR
jgi:hypothetical protein